MTKTKGSAIQKQAAAAFQPFQGEEDGAMPGGIGMAGPTAEDRLTEWVEMGVFPKSVAGLYFQLCQKSIDGETLAHEWTPKECEGQDPASLASMIYGQASVDASESATVTTYVAHAMRPDHQSFSRCVFRVAQEDLTRGMDSEPGHTPEGQMAQAHRHTEAFARMMIAQTQTVMHGLITQNKDYAVQASRAMKLQIDMVEMHQKLQDRQTERTIALRRAERREKMFDTTFGYVMQFLPDVFEKIGLVPGGMQQTIESAMDMERILCSLSLEQIKLVGAALPDPAHRQAFEKAYVLAKQREATAAARAAAHGKAPPNGQAPTRQVATESAGATNDATPGIDLTSADVPVLSKGAGMFLGMLFELPEEKFEDTIASMPESDQIDLRFMRSSMRNRVKGVPQPTSSKPETPKTIAVTTKVVPQKTTRKTKKLPTEGS